MKESERLSAELMSCQNASESLANQARSAQTAGFATSYINAIVGSGL